MIIVAELLYCCVTPRSPGGFDAWQESQTADSFSSTRMRLSCFKHPLSPTQPVIPLLMRLIMINRSYSNIFARSAIGLCRNAKSTLSNFDFGNSSWQSAHIFCVKEVALSGAPRLNHNANVKKKIL